MIVLDESALICDFAETYHILDYRSLPARQAAILAGGLREDSRIMMKIGGARAPQDTLLLALIADALQILVWQNTENGHKGKNRPGSIVRELTKEPKPSVGFASAEEFDRWRGRIVRKENG
ncbi:MAG: hypothetical protein IJ713_01340 [Oscillibacter sp.]|nr:hypothetical protein [Oscillibacter sp.]